MISDSTTPIAVSRRDEAYPLTYSMKIFIAHGVLLTLAFMVILPLGALQARLFRTIVPGKWWFRAHWIMQWPVATILITVGFGLGVNEVNKIFTGQLDSTHKKTGLALFCLYLVQCALGGFIHFVKFSNLSYRPPQNYLHAILGITIIGLSFWQVYTGLKIEWPGIGGPPVPMGFWIWWKVWIIMLPVVYLCGLALLPRQYRLEREQREKPQLPNEQSVPAPKPETRLGNEA